MGTLHFIKRIRQNYEKDGIISWFVCFCAFLANATVMGIDHSFGVAFGSIMHEFNSTETNVAWIGSVKHSVSYFSAALSSVMAEQFGFAPVIAVGLSVAATFFLISMTSYNVQTLTLYYGFFAGFGLGLIYTPINIICSFHFVKWRALATGIAECGSGVGIVIVSTAINFIIGSYGWKGCALVSSCACLFCIPLGIITYIVPEECATKNIGEREINDVDEQVKSCRLVILTCIHMYYITLNF